MNLLVSFVTDNDKFIKTMDEVCFMFEPFFDEFNNVEMLNPIHKEFSVIITDTKNFGFIEEMPDINGVFRVLAGIGSELDMLVLYDRFAFVINRAIEICSFSDNDRAIFAKLLSGFLEHNKDISRKEHK